MAHRERRRFSRGSMRKKNGTKKGAKKKAAAEAAAFDRFNQLEGELGSHLQLARAIEGTGGIGLDVEGSRTRSGVGAEAGLQRGPRRWRSRCRASQRGARKQFGGAAIQGDGAEA